MRTAMALFLMFNILLLGACGGCTRKQPDNKEQNFRSFPIKSFIKVITKIEIQSCKKDKECLKGEFFSSGSGITIGTIYGGSLVLTAGHVCDVKLRQDIMDVVKDYKTSISIANYKGRIVGAKIVKVAHNERDPRDLCLLFANDIKSEYVNFASRPARVGEDVFSMAAPAGLFHAPTVPLLRGIFSGPIGGGNVMTTIPATGGSSGGAILNGNMKIVGVLYATAREFNNVSLATSYIDTVLFVDEAVRYFLSMPVKNWKSNH